MALQINTTNEIGISTSYHKISKINIDNDINIELSSYINKSYRVLEQDSETKAEETKDLHVGITFAQDYSIVKRYYTFPLDKESEISFTELYTKLKALPDFKDAVDI